MRSFSVGFHSIGAVEVLDLVGELDAHTVSELEAAFQKCRQDGNHQIVVNGAHLLYISSAGLGVFLARIIHNSLQWRLPLPAKTDPTTPGGPEIRCGACRRLQGSQTGRENRLVRAQKHQQDVPLPHDLSPESDPP